MTKIENKTKVKKMVSARAAAEGKYLKAEHVKNSQNKIGVIIGAGEYNTKGDFGPKLEIPVQFNKVTKTWSLNKTSADALMKAYGEDLS